jgi:hypothetical protein
MILRPIHQKETYNKLKENKTICTPESKTKWLDYAIHQNFQTKQMPNSIILFSDSLKLIGYSSFGHA